MSDTLYIGGTWRPASDGKTFDVENPADESVLASVCDATADDAADAIAAAAKVQDEWGHSTVGERARLLRELHAALTENAEEFARTISAESGKPLAEACGEVAYGAQFLTWYADQATQLLHGEHYTDPSGSIRILTSRRPVGPSLLITPWNFPLAMITRKLAPALAAGCTTVIKPAEQTPLTAIRLVELLADRDVPAGVVNLLTSERPVQVSEAIFVSPALRKVSFTGSTSVGATLLRAAAPGIVSSSMELGGNAPLIVFDDAGPSALDEVMIAKLRNTGQSCIAANRLLVQSSIADDFTDALARRFAGMTAGTDFGPLIDGRAVAKVTAMVSEAETFGARVVFRGTVPDGPGYYYPPTVLADVPKDCALYRSEIFGPVATVTPFGSEDEAVALANDTEAGLAGYVFSADLSRAMRVGARLDFGIVGVNRGFVSTAAAPFGGVKTSGLGREGGLHGLDEYLETQYLSLPA
jgi:succinate-semialdehyde dehydrogenase/glutarate-semialdehyde dehydrogenase